MDAATFRPQRTGSVPMKIWMCVLWHMLHVPLHKKQVLSVYLVTTSDICLLLSKLCQTAQKGAFQKYHWRKLAHSWSFIISKVKGPCMFHCCYAVYSACLLIIKYMKSKSNKETIATMTDYFFSNQSSTLCPGEISYPPQAKGSMRWDEHWATSSYSTCP